MVWFLKSKTLQKKDHELSDHLTWERGDYNSENLENLSLILEQGGKKTSSFKD